MSESKIQSQIIKNLERDGYYVVKLIQTTKNGIPDLLAIKFGTAYFVEVKDLGEFPDKLQLHRFKELRKAGCVVHWTDDKNFTL
jgi:Holliday junction resolvase